MIGLFDEAEHATPLSVDDQKGMIPTWVTTRADLNVAEQDNILAGLAWAQRRRLKPLKIATDEFSRTLHRMMFGKVWKWAGRYRQSTLNIGVEPWMIANESAVLFDTFRYWTEHSTFSPDELAVQFHHRIVAVHPFPNGNGRHSRMMADLLVESLGGQPFTWGGGNLQEDTSELRRAYITTLKQADAHDTAPLLAFARS
ncbi:cell division protein Fic [Devosia psychrophila]|uniref:Cell division protein Fic n=1 Tax=Devosia psychrophila TaxID=728005 RepID=A0ABR5DT14_9HYPH|nr:mobile mystery protein B [Devosia psychrophila]KKC31161.1 cell division protein Fic [Devosia psychrophila]